jgi:hypothetical protein
MRPYQVFAGMTTEGAEHFFRGLAEKSPAAFAQAVAAASAALKSRPAYLMKQPFEKRAAAVRRALSRVSANPVAEEMLALYFLECRRPLLIEWLDQVGVEHDEGTLKEDAPDAPEESTLRAAVGSFRQKDDDPDRELLLQAFAAQSSIQWAALDALLAKAS